MPRRFVPCCLLLAAVASGALAQSSGGDYQLTRHTVDGGGGESSGGAFLLRGTVAQHDAAPSTAAGAGFALRGGFWTGEGGPRPDLLFADGFESP